MKRSYLLQYVSLFSLFLTGCEHVKHATSYEKKESKPGLFTGEKGYFEVVPGGPKTQEEFEKSPGILSDEGFGHKAAISSLSETDSLEAQAAS